jgi:hypothetical protein
MEFSGDATIPLHSDYGEIWNATTLRVLIRLHTLRIVDDKSQRLNVALIDIHCKFYFSVRFKLADNRGLIFPAYK